MSGRLSGRRLHRPVTTAVARTVIALPIIVWYIGHDMVSNLFVLIVAINLLRLDMPERGALVMILSNVIGGIVALFGCDGVCAFPP